MVTKKLCLVLLMICLVLEHVEGDFNEPDAQVLGKKDNYWVGSKSINVFITYIEFLQCILFGWYLVREYLSYTRNVTIIDELLVNVDFMLDTLLRYCPNAFNLYHEKNILYSKILNKKNSNLNSIVILNII